MGYMAAIEPGTEAGISGAKQPSVGPVCEGQADLGDVP